MLTHERPEYPVPPRRQTKLKFVGRCGGVLYWQSGRITGDSRVIQYSASAEWFYGTMRRG